MLRKAPHTSTYGRLVHALLVRVPARPAQPAAQAVVHLRSGLKPQVAHRVRASMHARLEQLHRHVRLRVLDLKGTKGGCEARVAIAAGRGPGDFIKMKSPITEASCALVELGSAVAALDALSC